MSLTYEEFRQIVPKDTLVFMEELLPYLDYYVARSNEMDFYSHSTVSRDSKTFFLTLYALTGLDEYMAFLGALGYKKSNYNILNKNKFNSGSLKELYEKFNYLIPNYTDKSLYQGLQPLEIVIDAYKKYYNNCETTIFDHIFEATSISNFKQKVNEFIENKKVTQDREIEKDLYKDVPISVVSHIETASKIRTLLLERLNYSQNGIARELDIDIVPLSLLLALYYNNNQSKDNLNNQGALVCLLQEKGITLEKILKSLNINITATEVKNAKKNIFAIKDLYSKYYQTAYSNSINKVENSVSVQSITKAILDRNFTGSLVIEKVLSSLNCSIDMFKNIESETIRAVELQKRNQEQESVKAFYKDAPKKTRDFMEFACKTYSLILTKMQENKHNNKILATEQDAAILSLYIASNFFNGKVSEFFNDNGVSFIKVMKLLNIDIKKEEIEKTQVDRKVLLDRFKRFVYEGENRNSSASKIGITEICYNMCNRDFNQSMLLENVYNSIAVDTEINSNFLTQMKDHFVEKKNRIELEKSQRLFYDIPVDTIKIVENASRLYHKLLKSKKGLDKKGAQSISILISALNSGNEEVQEFIKSLNIYSGNTCSYFDIDSRYIFSSPIDIDLLSKDYGLLMFGLANKDRKREELTPINLLRNIFSKDFNNSVPIAKFLAESKLSYNDFKNFDLLYQNYQKKKEKDMRDKEMKDFIEPFPSETENYIKNTTKIHNLIEKAKQEGRFKTDLIKTDEDYEALCLTIALFCENNNIREVYERNGLTKDKILRLFDLPENLLTNYSKEEIDYELIKNRYKKYLNIEKSKSSTYLMDVFKNLIESNDYMSKIIVLSKKEYEVFEREITTGKRYEDTLTVADRIKKLSSQQIDELDSTSMQSILDFGNGLIPHSNYIHDKLPNLIGRDVTEESITKISGLIGEIYVKEEKEEQEQGFLSRLFLGEKQQPAPRLLLNRSKLYELERTIDEKVEKLKEELLEYDGIRRYIEEYSKRNRAYGELAESATEEVTTKLTELDPNNDDDYSAYLSTNTLLQILADKQNRFSTVNLLMKKELLKVNQAIVNHFITINSLEMARDDLIPLIESEIILAKGQNSETEAISLSQNVMGLFQALLTRNVDGAMESVEKLQHSNIPEELMTSINNDINTYMQGISQIRLIETKMETQEEAGKVLVNKPSKK